MPKNNLGIVNLSTGDLFSADRVKSFKLPKEAGGWIAYHLEKSDKKKEPEKKILNDEEARKEIAEYMERQNRPYSVQNIIDNLHGRVKKKQVEKITEGLVEEKVLTVKEYGKSKIFMINQALFPKVD